MTITSYTRRNLVRRVGRLESWRTGHTGRVRRTAPLLLVTMLLAACNGGTVDLHSLKNDSDAINSLACEGALLANQVVHGASTSPFTRVHAGELSTRASNFADALSQRPTTPGIEGAVRREARKAGKI